MLREVSLTSWDEFKSKHWEYFPGGAQISRALGKPPVLFRGQADSEWPLIAAFDRAYSTIDYEEMLRNFCKECLTLDGQIVSEEELKALSSKNPAQGDHDKIVGLAQHYGLPTRHLDWSASPYIAAYFAYSHALLMATNRTAREIKAQRASIAIWAVTNVEEWSAFGMRIVATSKIANRRLQAQQGYFTEIDDKTARKPRVVENILALTDSPYCVKFSLPLSEAPTVMHDLQLMRIDARQLLGGIEGVATATLERAILQKIQREANSAPKSD